MIIITHTQGVIAEKDKKKYQQLMLQNIVMVRNGYFLKPTKSMKSIKLYIFRHQLKKKV